MTGLQELQDAILGLEAQQELISKCRSRLSYNPETGVFTWTQRVNPKVPSGAVAGSDAHGYRAIRVDGQRIYCHRLAWAFVHGSFPTHCIDHINGVRHDNRIANLRDVTNQVNLQNARLDARQRRSGVAGVRKMGNVFAARIMCSKKEIHLGCFSRIEDAGEAYLQAKRALHMGFTG